MDHFSSRAGDLSGWIGDQLWWRTAFATRRQIQRILRAESPPELIPRIASSAFDRRSIEPALATGVQQGTLCVFWDDVAPDRPAFQPLIVWKPGAQAQHFRRLSDALWDRWVAPPKRLRPDRRPLYARWENLVWLRQALNQVDAPFRPLWASDPVLPTFDAPPQLFPTPQWKALLGGQVVPVPRTPATDELLAIFTWPRAMCYLTDHYVRAMESIGRAMRDSEGRGEGAQPEVDPIR